MKKSFFFVAVAALAFAACQKVENPVEEPAALVKIEPLITRATSTNFETGDQIGVTIVKGEAEHASNACLTYSENEQAFSGDLKWYEQGGESCTIKAFYPYQASGFPTSFTVAADQRGGASASDFMVAAKTNVFPQRAAVAMQFRHYMSQLVVNINNKADAEIEFVTFKDLVCTASVAVEGDVVTVAPAGTQASDIMAECVTANQKYRAIIVPQTSVLKMEIKVKGGNVLVTDIPESTIKQGYSYNISAEITADNVKVALTGEIQNWDDGGDLTGDQKAEVSFHEYLSAAQPYFEYDNVNYKVVKLADGKWWMAEPMIYLPAGVVPSDTPSATSTATVYYPYATDGTTCTALKDDASIKAKGYLYKAAAVFGQAVTADNRKTFEGAQGICPKGWHVPTRAEFLNLVGYSNKSSDLGETAAQTVTSAVYYNTAYNGGKIPELNAAGFNFVLGGAVANGIYQKLALTSSNCTVEAFYGNPAMTYIWTSSSNNATQLFAVMTTFTKAAYPEGRATLGFADFTKGANQLRCVRDVAE